MGKNLGAMIDEINTSSAAISKTQESDPLTQIVQIMTAHMASLQWIDANTRKLQEKVEQVKGVNNEFDGTAQSFFASRR
ncbi:hypothetical protein SAICODRAFT_30126 [Saitoella complicata NRRL Y-17804]|nr:uncharacterized protein SAICODRAFT_30126 [Saitoella complicata NRRL Y-17804]ODQ53422.1 hypothetical protein SAICODRAFT_30126 [Saitoella complicata NRRL Y-17804]